MCCSAVIWSAAVVSGSVSSVFAQICETKTRGGRNQFWGNRDRSLLCPPWVLKRAGYSQVGGRRSAGFDLEWELDTELAFV